MARAASWLMVSAAAAIGAGLALAVRSTFYALAWVLGATLLVALAVVLHPARRRRRPRPALRRTADRRSRRRLRRALGRARSDIARRDQADQEAVRLRDQLLQAQKMEAIARLAGGVAHDMNNALTSITTVCELLLEDERFDDVVRDDLCGILGSAKRCAELSHNLLAFSRRGKYACDVLAIGPLVESARHVLAGQVPAEVEIRWEAAEPELAVEGDASQLVSAIVNLCLNAAAAMPDGGVVSVRTERGVLRGNEAHRRAVTPGDYVALRVRDSGEGMDSESRRRAFEPFFSSKPDGRGSGLGLAMVYGTARNHGGHAEVENAPGGGTVVTLWLPLVASGARDRSSAPPSGPRADLSEKVVLLVDDEPSVRAAAKRILERMGPRVHVAESGRRALAAWTSDGPFDLVVLDVAMPIMSGREFFSRLRRLAPSARVLLVSGLSPDADAQAMLEMGALGYVEKPYTPTALARAVRAALATEPTAPAGRLAT